MNNKLIEELRRGMTEDRRREITRLVARSGAPNHSLVVEITEPDMAKMCNIAADYISRAVGRLATREPTFQTMAAATSVVEGLDALMKNPATVNYTQAVIMLTVALLTEQEEEEP